MFYEGGRLGALWLSWLVAGVCGVLILLAIICYCRLMPRHQKSFDEQYHKENYVIKENYAYSSQENYRLKHAEVAAAAAAAAAQRLRPASYAGSVAAAGAAQYASSAALDEDSEPAAGGGAAEDALKTRSLPAFLRGRPRPLSAAAAEPAAARASPDPAAALLHPLLAKVSVSKKCANRMRSEHAAIIALSRARARPPRADADPVVVYDQRTQL